MQIIRSADCLFVPWKNGAGQTQELWRLADESGEALVRISIAEIEGDQVFSSFPGIDRVIMQLDGPGMELTIDGQQHPLGVERSLPFKGEAIVTCKLGDVGKAHDLNLMCRRDTFCAAMTVVSVTADESFSLGKKASHTALVALARCTLVAPSHVTLQPWDTLMFGDTEVIKFAAAARFAVLSATPL